MASRIRRNQISAREVMAAHIAQIETVNPKVNAIVTLVGERAMADAARADEHSVPGEFTASGLPVGVQIVRRHHDEWSVLQLAHAFEEATQHGKRRPPVANG